MSAAKTAGKKAGAKVAKKAGKTAEKAKTAGEESTHVWDPIEGESKTAKKNHEAALKETTAQDKIKKTDVAKVEKAQAEAEKAAASALKKAQDTVTKTNEDGITQVYKALH